MKVFELLNELSNELSDKKGIFKKIDFQKCQRIIEEITHELPDVIKEAEYIVENKESILQNSDLAAKKLLLEAEEEAEKRLEQADKNALEVVENARRQAEGFLMESEIVKRAEEYGQNLVDNAYDECQTVTEQTFEHLDSVFGEVESFLLRTANMIKNNRAELTDALGLEKKE